MSHRGINAIIILIALFLYGCDNGENNTVSLEEIIEEELQKGSKHDSIFLEYRLGMSSKEFKSHTKSLIAKGVLKKVDGDLIHEMVVGTTGHEIFDLAKIEILPEFYNDSLYTLGLEFVIKETDYRLSKDEWMLYEPLLAMYNKKYGIYSYKDEGENNYDHQYYWINGNRLINLYMTVPWCIRVKYLDTRRVRAKRKHLKMKRESQVESL